MNLEPIQRDASTEYRAFSGQYSGARIADSHANFAALSTQAELRAAEHAWPRFLARLRVDALATEAALQAAVRSRKRGGR